jgi:predicted lipase
MKKKETIEYCIERVDEIVKTIENEEKTLDEINKKLGLNYDEKKAQTFLNTIHKNEEEGYVKNLSDKSIADIAIELIKRNYNSLGNGWFGFVFDNPKKSNEVIKFWLDDPAYEAFLKVAETIKSPHIIKIIKRGSITLNLNSEYEPIKIKYVKYFNHIFNCLYIHKTNKPYISVRLISYYFI